MSPTDILTLATDWTLVSVSIGGIYAMLSLRVPRSLEIDFNHGGAN